MKDRAFFITKIMYNLQSFVYHPWTFDEDILSRFGGDSHKMTNLKIRKSTISQTGSDVITRKIIFGPSRPIYTIPENFMKIRPGVLEKSSKKKKIIIVKKKKPKNNNKVFRWKRKTLITRHDLVASNEEVFRPIGP